MKVLNFGSLNIDRTYEVEAFVQGGQTVSSTSYQELLGGKGLNQSVALKRAGADVYHVGAIGKVDGQPLKEALISNGISVDYLLELDQHSGHAVIQINATGNNCIIVEGGTNLLISQDYIDQVLAQFDEPCLVLVQNEISNVDYVIRRAHELGHQVALNPSPINSALLAAPLELVDLFILNEVEGYELTGEREAEKILTVLKKKYPRATIILTLGEKGSIYCRAGEVELVRCSAFQTQVVDTTGAGDTFTGYVIAQLLAGEEVDRSLSVASMASSLSIGVKGAVNSIPEMVDVQKSLEKC